MSYLLRCVHISAWIPCLHTCWGCATTPTHRTEKPKVPCESPDFSESSRVESLKAFASSPEIAREISSLKSERCCVLASHRSHGCLFLTRESKSVAFQRATTSCGGHRQQPPACGSKKKIIQAQNCSLRGKKPPNYAQLASEAQNNKSRCSSGIMDRKPHESNLSRVD